MTNRDDQLRDALVLLEHRAPHMSASTLLTVPTRTRLTPRRWALPLASAAAVIVGVAVVATLSRTSSPHSAANHQKPSATSTANADTTTCLQTPAHRQGAENTLVPGTPNSVTICQYPTGPEPAATTTTNIGALVAALKALPTSPMPRPAGCRPRYPGALPARGTYELHFHYSTGPDVVVNVLPECSPSVNNSTSLQAENAATVVTVLQQIVPRRNSQYKALVVTTGCVGAQCANFVYPKRLASLVHATACLAWVIDPGNHGGPRYFIRMLLPTGDAHQARVQAARLAGVQSVNTAAASEIERGPTTKQNGISPTPTRCD